MASKDIIEKAKVGDEKVYQGVTYYVAALNAAGKPLWRKKKEGSSKSQPEGSGGTAAKTTPPAASKQAQAKPAAAPSGDKKTDFSNMSDDELTDYANEAKTSSLEAVVNNKSIDKKVRKIAFDVLKNRDDYDEKKVDSSDLGGGSKKKEYPYQTKKPAVDINIGKFTVQDKNGRRKQVTADTYKSLFEKYDDDKLLKYLNNKNLSAQIRQVAYEIAADRNIPEDKIDVSGSLQKFWDKEKEKYDDLNGVGEEDDDEILSLTTVDTGLGDFDSEKFMEQFPEGDMGWMDSSDPRIQKEFNGLKTMKDRQLYDNFLDNQKRQRPNYVPPKRQLSRMMKGYLAFLDEDNNRPMLIAAGGAGVGKTYGLRKVLKEYKGLQAYDEEQAAADPEYNDYDYIFAPQINSLPKLAKFLSKNRDKIVVFDDNDNIITDHDIANVMKTLGDTNPKARYFPEYDEKGKATGKNGVFTGKMVILTNKSSDFLNRNEDAKAVMSRASKQEIKFTVQENIDTLQDRYKTMDTGVKIKDITKSEDEKIRQDIFDYIVEHKDKLDPAKFTVRKFIDVYEKIASERLAELESKYSADAAEDFEPEDWRDSALEILNKAQSNEFADYDVAFYNPEDEWTDEQKKRLSKIAKKIDEDLDKMGADDDEDETPKKKKGKKVKKSFDIDFGMTLDEAEDLLFGDTPDILKARSGVYADTAENRKLGRVGQKYGGNKKSELDKKKVEMLNNQAESMAGLFMKFVDGNDESMKFVDVYQSLIKQKYNKKDIHNAFKEGLKKKFVKIGVAPESVNHYYKMFTDEVGR